MASPDLSTRLLVGASRLTARAAPVAARLFPETMQFDDNRSLWASQTPDYQPGAPLRETIRADLAIIGGGFTGVSTAYHFSRRYPDKRVVLLEAKSLANGASGRNGGLMLNWLSSMAGLDPEMTARVYQMTSAGIQMIVEIIRRHDLPVSHRCDGTLTVYTDSQRAEAAHAEAELHQQLGIPSRFLDSSQLKDQLWLRGVHGGVFDPDTGQINGAQLVRALRPVLVERGVEIYEQTPVLSIREGAEITLTTPAADVRAKAIVLATNGYTGKLGYFQDAVFPLHSHVLATAPLSSQEQTALGWRQYAGFCDDLDRIAYASLTPDGHLVFGGGSNQSYAYRFGNHTAYPGQLSAGSAAYQRMRQTLHGYLPQTDRLIAPYRWTGTLGITLNRQALMGVRGEHRNIFYAIGYCGHGVTLANIAGQILTDCYSGADEQWRGLPFYQVDYLPIPPEPFRWVGYQLFTRLTGRSPRV